MSLGRGWLAVALAIAAAVAVGGCGDDDASPLDGGRPVDAARRDAAVIPCTGDTACTAPETPRCDVASGRCVACLASADCTGEHAPVCARNSCLACVSDAECMTERGAARCRSDGACVECTRPSECSAASPYCSPDGTCADCASDADCWDGAPVCMDGACRSCTEVTCDGAQALRELFAIQCAALVALEGSQNASDGLEALLCSAHRGLWPLLDHVEAGVRAGRIRIDPMRFAACRTGVGSELLPADCGAAIVGLVADGEACTEPFECASRRCDVPDRGCVGTCVPLVPMGGTCTSASECVEGLICTGAMCITPPGDGAPCTGQCADGLFCNAAGTCEGRHALGGACRAFRDTDCVDGLRCVGTMCAGPPVAGAACWPIYASPRCAAGTRCVADVCTTTTAVGAPCTDATPCVVGARCTAGMCREVLDLGAPCTATDACPLGTGCTDGRCRSLADVGGSCFGAGGCVRGICRDGTCASQSAGASCPPSEGGFLFDVLDPCGVNSTCGDVSGTWQCVAEGGVGDDCRTPGTPFCRNPDTYCAEDGRCSEYCTPIE